MLRYEFRFHNGTVWTADVSVNGVRYVDPYGVEPAPVAATAGSGRHPGSGLALAAMILGIVAISLAWMPFLVAVGAICAALAVVFGAIGLARSRSGDRARGFAIAGLVTGLVGAALCVVGVMFTGAVLRAVDRYENPADNEAVITSCDIDGSITTVRGELTNLSDEEADFGVVVAISRPGTDNVHRRARTAVDDVAPGATTEFELFRRVALSDVECDLVEVTGPLPFGLEIE
jgi:hypothetical protein